MVSIARLTIGLDPIEGALVRLLGTIERRGFDLAAVEMEGARVELAIAPRGAGRSVDVLARQLERLIEVRSVRQGPVQ